MWPRLDRALGWVGEGAGDTHESIQSEGPQDKASILSADALVPAAIRDDWNEASAIKLRLVDFYTSDLEDLGNQEYRDRQQEALGFEDPKDFQAVIDEFGEPPPDVDHIFWAANRVSNAHRDAIDAWVTDNCESVGVSGLPGVVRVEDPGRSRDRLLIAVMPVGTDLGEIEDASDFLAVACSQRRPGEVWESPLLERNSGFDQPCIDRYREDLGARSAVLAAGDYELFIGSFSRGVGNFDTYVPAPDLCVVVPLTVDGDTELTVPDLEPCDLGPLAGTAEEIARRQRESDTGGTTGTLRVTLSEHLSDEGVHVDYRLAVLPAGTTLNQIALGDAWPVGVGCMGLDRPIDADLREESDQRQADFEEADRQAVNAAARRQSERDQLEGEVAQLQVEREELEHQEAELGQLSDPERAEAERHIADRWGQIEQTERHLSDRRTQLEEERRGAEFEAENREHERQQFLSFANPIREAIAGGGVPVPILPFPADPQSPECSGGPHEYLGFNEDGWTGPEPAQLPAGDYDVYVFVDLWNEEMGNESQQQCATLTASVAGETLVKAPPLEDCP